MESIELIDFDDGHSPGATKIKTKLALYKGKHRSNFFAMFDGLLPEDWCTRAYNYALERKRPWGAYITTEDALNSAISAEDIWANKDFERAISLMAVRSLFFERAKGLVGTDAETIHGTAVWCLCSDETDSVQYHIDYAELYRYETNVIYPPMYAGTCQLSPVHSEEEMIGGDFQANIGGVEHYRKFGYKCKLSTEEAFAKDLRSADWVTARYRHNRGIIHDGDYPHLSTPVTYVRPGLKRVILGFNCFPAETGECCMRAPEHSDAFNRTIKLYQTMAALGVPITAFSSADVGGKYTAASDAGVVNASTTAGAAAGCGDVTGAAASTQQPVKKGMNVKDIMKNPALAKLLVTAAKKLTAHEKMEKEQRELKLQQQDAVRGPEGAGVAAL